MTGQLPPVRFADAGEAADVAAFLARLIHYDKAAVVRLRGGADTLAVFGRPPSFEVLAVRTARLAGASSAAGSAGSAGATGAQDAPIDVTVSAGELLESVDEATATAVVPAAVTGPPWAGVLPPKGGWERVPGLPGPAGVLRAVRAAVGEFRARVEELDPPKRTRGELDRIGREVWSRPVGDTELPVRAAHAARSLGFLRDVGEAGVDSAAAAAAPSAAAPSASAVSPSSSASGSPSGPGELSLWSAGVWLRLRTPYGAVVVRGALPGGGLDVLARG